MHRICVRVYVVYRKQEGRAEYIRDKMDIELSYALQRSLLRGLVFPVFFDVGREPSALFFLPLDVLLFLLLVLGLRIQDQPRNGTGVHRQQNAASFAKPQFTFLSLAFRHRSRQALSP